MRRSSTVLFIRGEPRAASMRFSLKTLFLITLGAAILLAAMRTPFFLRLSIIFPLLGFAVWNVLCVAGVMYALAGMEWLIRKMRR